MINKKDLEAYRSITAPESLKARLLEEQSKNNRSISLKARICCAAAAILIVAATVLALLPSSRTMLYYGEKAIDKNAILFEATNSNARIATAAFADIRQIPLTVKTDKRTVLTVTDGSIIISEADMGSTVTIEDDTDIIWAVSLSDTSHEYILTVGNEVFCIIQNDNSEWVLSKK